MLFERIFQSLNAGKVKYLIIGGIAVNLYGYVRATGDMDIVVSFDPKNMENFIAVVKKLGLVPRIPVSVEDFADPKKREYWMKEKNLLVFSVYNPKNTLELLDIAIDDGLDFHSLYRRRVSMKLNDMKIPVISIDDLIAMKKEAGRDRDQIDVEKLKLIKAMHHGKKK